MPATFIADDKNYSKSHESPLDLPVAVTRFTSAAAMSKRTLTLSMRELADRIEDSTAPSKALLPWFKLARFGSDRTDKRCLRHNANVKAVSGLEADYDGGAVTIDDAASRLHAEGVAALLYSTPSSTAVRPRWRVFAPFAQEHRPEARTAFMERLNAIFEGKIDGASFTLSQAFYGGNVEGKRPIKTRLVEGDCIDTLDGLPRLPKGGRERTASTTSGERLGLSIEDAGRYLAEIADDPEWRDRDAGWRTVGMGLHHEFDGEPEAFDLWHRFSKASKFYDFRELRDRWQSFGRYRGEPVTFRSIIEAARGEWALTYAEAVEIFEDLPRLENPKRHGLTFLTPADCATRVEREYVVKGMLAKGDVGCIVGAPGVGKSLIAPHIGYAVAQGESVFGMRTRQGDVFYVAAEDEHGMRNRVTALRMRHGEADGFTLVGGVSDLLSKGSADLKELRAAVERERPALIFIDTLAIAFPGLEENTAEGMGRVVAVARSLTKWGAAVVLIHHDTKDGQQGLPRGHSLLNGALDMSIHLTGSEDDGIVRGRLTKNRNGPCDRDMAFRVDAVELGTDRDGDPVTAGLCDELSPHAAQRGPKLTPSAKAALGILTELIEEEGRVAEERWRDVCVSGREVSAAETRDNRRRIFRAAAMELTRVRKVKFENGFYRIPNPFDNFERQNDDII